jgi:hypothetical protein
MLTRLLPILVAAFVCWCLGWLPVEMLWFLPVAFLFPSCGCCGCPTCQPCTSCVDNLYPAYVDVEISGVVDDTCTDCEGINGLYSVPVVCVFGSCCSSSENFGATTSCGTLTMTIQFSGSYNILVQVTITAFPTSQVTDFILTGTSKPDCSRWSGQAVPFSVQSHNLCDFSGATLTITAS